MKPPTTLLIGAIGTGKTSALATYRKAGLKLAVLFTEPGGPNSLIERHRQLGLSLDDTHWTYVPSASHSWAELIAQTDKVGRASYQDLTQLKASGKKAQTQFYKLYSSMAEFKCDHCDKNLGPIDELDETWAFGFDSTSGVNEMALQMVVGDKPVAHEGEYGVAMNMEAGMLKKLAADMHSFVCVTGHIEKAMSPLTGQRIAKIALLGKQLANKDSVAKDYDDVVQAWREAGRFYWSTDSTEVDLKNRALPLGDHLDPTFEQIVDRYNEWKKETTGKEDATT